MSPLFCPTGLIGRPVEPLSVVPREPREQRIDRHQLILINSIREHRSDHSRFCSVIEILSSRTHCRTKQPAANVIDNGAETIIADALPIN